MPGSSYESERCAEDYSLFVTNLPPELNEDGIEKIFKKYGTVKALMVRNEGQFAFVSYSTYTEAENAVSSLDAKPPLYLRVQFRKKRTEPKGDDGQNSPNAYSLHGTTALESISSPQWSIDRDDSHQGSGSRYSGSKFHGVRTDLLRIKIPPSAVSAHQYQIDSTYPVVTPPLMYNPYDEIEYADTNALWSRGCMTVDAAGRKHVTLGRGHTFYYIPEPHPRVIDDIGKVYEKRNLEHYEYGVDQCKEYVGKCMYCLRHATLCCSFCDGFYCSRDCQIADWPKHQTQCRKIPPLISANCVRESTSMQVADQNSNNSHISSAIAKISKDDAPPPSIHSVKSTTVQVDEDKNLQILRRPKVSIDSSEKIKINEATAEWQTSSITQQQVTTVTATATSGKGSTERKSANENDKMKSDKKAKKMNSPASVQKHNRVDMINENIFEFKRTVRKTAADFLSPSNFTDVQIVDIKEPGRLIFVQKVEQLGELTKLMETLNDNIEQFTAIDKPMVGKIYGVIYDNVWHRGFIVSLNPTIIDYIDYGTISKVPENISIRDIGNLAEIPRFSELIRLPENFFDTSKTLMPDCIIRVKMTHIDIEDDKSIINVVMSAEKNSFDLALTVPLVADDQRVRSPVNVLNFLTAGMKVIAEVGKIDDENTATVVLHFDTVSEMFESLLDPLKDDCNEVAPNHTNYQPNIHEFVCVRKPGDVHWLRGCVLKLSTSDKNSSEVMEIASVDEGVVITQVEKIIPLTSKYSDICIFSALIKTVNIHLSALGVEAGSIVNLDVTEVETSDRDGVVFVRAILVTDSVINGEVQLYPWTPWQSGLIETGKLDTNIATESDKIESSQNSIEESSNKKKTIDRFNLKNDSKVILQSYRSPSVAFLRSLEPEEVERYNCLAQAVAKRALTAPQLDVVPEVGGYVLAQYVDGNYYRALILSAESECKIKIVYVDYGNAEVTTLNKLKHIPDSLMDEPCCTRKVTLKGIKSVPPTPEAHDYLKLLAANETELLYQFDDSGDSGDASVILKVATDVTHETVNDKINHYLTPTWELNQNMSDSSLNSVQLEVGTTVKEKEVVPQTKSLVLSDIESGKLGNPGDKVSALFLDTIEPGFKYVFAPEDREMIVHVTSVMPALMKVYCESTNYYIPRDNELCIALYEDNNWYRGCCFNATASPTSALIYFLDFGNLAMVSHENIRMMTKDFLKPATFGCVCSVHDFIDSSTPEVSSKVLARLETLLLPNETYKAEIIKFDGEEYEIKLLDIHSQLVAEGLLKT